MSDWFSTGYDRVKEESAKTNYSEEFRLGDGETAKIRFLTEEPLNFRQHNLHVDGKWPKYTCRQGLEGGCPLCKAGDTPRFVGAYTIFDYRDNKVKIYIQGIRVLKVLDRLHAREGGLMGQDFEVSRSGKGTDTSYNFIPLSPTKVPDKAKDDTGKLKVLDMRSIFAPKSVDQLEGVASKAFGITGSSKKDDGDFEDSQWGVGF